MEPPPGLTPLQALTAQTSHYRSIISDMKHDYHKLSTRFDSLPLSARRSIDRPYIQERFNCTAILQFLADVAEVNRSNVEDNCGHGSVAKLELPCDEHCPVARDWYASLFEAEDLVNAAAREGITISNVEQGAIEDALSRAGKGLQLVKDWVGLAMFAEEDGDEHSLRGLIEAWNVLCEEVGDAKFDLSKGIESASFWLHTRGNPSFELAPKQGARRLWFEWCPPLPK